MYTYSVQVGYFSGKVSWENTFHSLCSQKHKKTVSSMDPDAPTREGYYILYFSLFNGNVIRFITHWVTFNPKISDLNSRICRQICRNMFTYFRRESSCWASEVSLSPPRCASKRDWSGGPVASDKAPVPPGARGTVGRSAEAVYLRRTGLEGGSYRRLEDVSWS